MEVFKIFGTLGLRDNEYRQGLSRAEQQGQRASNNINKGFSNTGNMFGATGAAAMGMGASMLGVAGVTVGVGAALVGTISAGANFEKQLSSVKAMTGATDAQMAQMTAQAKQLGAETKFSASQAAEGMAFLGMAGFKTNDIMAAMPGMLNLAAAGNLDLGRAADIASNIMAGFGLEASQAGHAADVLAYASSNSNTNVEQLGEAMKYASGTASTVGFSMEETTAAMMAMADVGLQGSVAGQAFASSLGRLAKPSKEAQKAIDAMNISFFDQQGKIKPLPAIIGELEKGMGGMSEKQKTATLQTIFGAEAFKNWAALIKKGSTTLEENTTALEKSNGKAKEMADTMNDNLIGAWDGFTSKVEGLAITIFGILAPALYGILAGATAAVSGIDSFIQAIIPMDSYIQGIQNMTEAIKLMWKTASGDGEAGIAAVDLMTSMGLSPEAQEMAMSVIYNIQNGINLLKALVSGDWGEASKIMDKLGITPEAQAQITSIAQSIGVVISNLANIIGTMIGVAAQLVVHAWGLIMSATTAVWGAILPFVQPILSALASFVGSASTIISNFWKNNMEPIKTITTVVWNVVTSVTRAAMAIFGAVISATMGIIGPLISQTMNVISTVISVVLNVITGNWSGAWSSIKDFFSSTWDNIVSLAQGFVNGIGSLFQGFVSAIGNIFAPVAALIGAPFEAAWKTVDKVVGWIGGAVDKVAGFIGKIGDGAKALGGFVGLSFSAPVNNVQGSGGGAVAASSVNGFENGGLFKPNNERMIKIGDAKKYDEAVLPLEKGVLGMIGDKISENMKMQQPEVIEKEPPTFIIEVNGKRFARAIADDMNQVLGGLKVREVRQ
ncbi:phage tail tape measure protein [Bacillus sp. COPE52]|uniref:phage tail tape measure protein n=1 Tax=Bacillus sp. COPE52 TaxID=2233998 RepID=UPI000E109679|nr:phage tail tape measure protein [Bacillus sp. COPE52]AXK19122.1 phage tail tape measure protein [Bacillus sp. COPE52]